MENYYKSVFIGQNGTQITIHV